jgi:hypothetical protein
MQSVTIYIKENNTEAVYCSVLAFAKASRLLNP